MSDERRWAHDAEVLDCVEADTLILMPSGEVMADVKVAVGKETYERMLAGRVCCNCFEPQEEAFPERCEALKLPDGTVVGCWYPIRARQLLDMEKKHEAGETVHIGSRINRADEIERLRELDDYENRTGVILPDSVKFPTEIVETRKR